MTTVVPGERFVDHRWSEIKINAIIGNHVNYATHVSLQIVYYLGAWRAFKYVRDLVAAKPDTYMDTLNLLDTTEAAIDVDWNISAKLLLTGGTQTEGQLDLLKKMFAHGFRAAIYEACWRIDDKPHSNRIGLLDRLISNTAKYQKTIESEVQQEHAEKDIGDAL